MLISLSLSMYVGRSVGQSVGPYLVGRLVGRSYLPNYIPTYLPIYLHTYLPTYLLGRSVSVPTYLSTYVPTGQSVPTRSVGLSVYPPTYLPTCSEWFRLLLVKIWRILHNPKKGNYNIGIILHTLSILLKWTIKTYSPNPSSFKKKKCSALRS